MYQGNALHHQRVADRSRPEAGSYIIDADTLDPNPDGSPYELGSVCDGPFEQDEAEAEAKRRNAIPHERGIVYIVVERG
jgi:hypothetical protein